MVTLQLEAGKFYRDGRGKKIGPIFALPITLPGQRYLWGAQTSQGYPHEWTSNGRTSLNKFAPKGPFDLFEEWTDD